LSNVYSLFNIVKDKDWFSLKPTDWKDKMYLNPYEKTLWQYNRIIKSIEKDILRQDTLMVNYEDICENPHQFLKNVTNFVAKRNIKLSVEYNLIPKYFKNSNIDEGLNKEVKRLKQLIENE
jgi:hypothetical protein